MRLQDCVGYETGWLLGAFSRYGFVAIRKNYLPFIADVVFPADRARVREYSRVN